MDNALLAEVFARDSAAGIQRDQPPVIGPEQDAPVPGIRAFPVGHAAMRAVYAPGGSILRIVCPSLAPTLSVERDDPIGWAGEVERSVDDDRGGFEAWLPVSRFNDGKL